MATIRELVETHSKVPGDIKITHFEFNDGWVRPFFIGRESIGCVCWIGLDEVGDSVYLPLDEDSLYRLYTEPKAKVKRWLWAVHDRDGIYVDTEFMSESEVAKSDREKIKLEWSMQEFDE